MMQFLCDPNNMIFTVALGLMLAIAFLEIVTSIFGFALSHFIDGLVGLHVLHLGDAISGKEAIADAFHTSEALQGKDVALHMGDTLGKDDLPLFTRFVGWIRFGQVPLLIVMISFLTIFSSIGLLGQNIFKSATNHYLPWIIVVWPALFLTLPLVRGISKFLGKFCVKDETSAVSPLSFIGKIAEITIGVATKSSPAEAKLKDEFNQTHYIMVVPESETETYSAQTKVKITGRQQEHLFTVIKLI